MNIKEWSLKKDNKEPYKDNYLMKCDYKSKKKKNINKY
jgi:hypothetical protein